MSDAVRLDVEPEEAPCPPWCGLQHDGGPDDDAHRGPLHAIDVRGRRHFDAPERIEPADERERLEAQLVRYRDDPTVWIAVRTRTGVPIEVAIDDANRWVILLGSAMVDARD